MFDPIEELKVRARLLQKRASDGDADALSSLHPPKTTPEAVRRKQCLAAVARRHGFRSWAHAVRVLEGHPDEVDFGTMLYPGGCGAFLNAWYADYETARVHREKHGGYLLAYKRQFLVVTRDFIETLGLDPDDAAWDRIGWDWVRPRDISARQHLYAMLIEHEVPRQED